MLLSYGHALFAGLDRCGTEEPSRTSEKGDKDKTLEDGKADRIAKFADMFGSKTLEDAIREASEDAGPKAA